MARPTSANTRKAAGDKAAAAKRKTKEDKEESKEINYDDDDLGLSDGSDTDQSEGETKDLTYEGGDSKSDTYGFESENLEKAKPKKKKKKTKAKKTKAAAGYGDDDAPSSEAESVSSHDKCLAKKRRVADDLEADKRTCAAKMKADAARSRAISKSAEPLLCLFMWLGVDEMDARRIINMEAFHDDNCLVELDDNRIESICHVNRRREDYDTTYISGSG